MSKHQSHAPDTENNMPDRCRECADMDPQNAAWPCRPALLARVARLGETSRRIAGYLDGECELNGNLDPETRRALSRMSGEIRAALAEGREP